MVDRRSVFVMDVRTGAPSIRPLVGRKYIDNIEGYDPAWPGKSMKEDKQEMKVLDLGCGNRKRGGALGVDVNPATNADVVHDLNIFPYPLPDSSFDEIYMDNVLEHLDDVIKVMEEIYRISKPDAAVKIIVPYFRARWAFIDPTHRHFFSIDSFSYFDPGHVHNRLYNYSHARFRIEKVVFNEDIIRRGPMRPVFGLLKMLANRFPLYYEAYLGNIFPLDSLTFHLRAIK